VRADPKVKMKGSLIMMVCSMELKRDPLTMKACLIVLMKGTCNPTLSVFKGLNLIEDHAR